MKKLLSVLLVLMLLLPAAALAEDGSLAAVQEKGQFVLGLDDSFPPMGFRDDANEIVGFDIDLAKAVCERLGVELICQPIDWSAKEMELSSGNIDCIWNGMSITPEREESMAMTASYMNNKINLYVKGDAGIAGLEDMAGKKLAVQGGSFAEEVLNEEGYAQFKSSLSEVLAFDDYLTALMDLQAGNVDGVLMDLVVAEYKLSGMGDESIVSVASLADDNYGIGFRKDDIALRDAVWAALKDMSADGDLLDISVKWFGSNISTVE